MEKESIHGVGLMAKESIVIVGVVVFDSDRNPHMIMIKRNPEDKLEPGKEAFPAGHINNGETAQAAAGREAREETKLDMLDSHMLQIGSTFTSQIRHKDGKLSEVDVTLFICTATNLRLEDVRMEKKVEAMPISLWEFNNRVSHVALSSVMRGDNGTRERMALPDYEAIRLHGNAMYQAAERVVASSVAARIKVRS